MIPAWQVLQVGLRHALYWRWRLHSRGAGRIEADDPRRATVIVSAFSPHRVRNLWPLTRQLLRCDCVDRVIITNNNPEMRLALPAALDSKRVTLLNQDAKRGAGFRWLLASTEPGDYIICLDDDLLIYPEQLASLFQGLLADPGSPHGIAGRRDGRYVIGRDAEVDELCTAYAVTREQVQRFGELVGDLEALHGIAPETVELWADDTVISRTGQSRPRVDAVGYLAMCPTADAGDTALSQQSEFHAHRAEVRQALLATLAAEKAADRPSPARAETEGPK